MNLVFALIAALVIIKCGSLLGATPASAANGRTALGGVDRTSHTPGSEDLSGPPRQAFGPGAAWMADGVLTLRKIGNDHVDSRRHLARASVGCPRLEAGREGGAEGPVACRVQYVRYYGAYCARGNAGRSIDRIPVGAFR